MNQAEVEMVLVLQTNKKKAANFVNNFKIPLYKKPSNDNKRYCV